MLNVYKIVHNSKIYGPGTRDVIWFRGCSLRCKNCINPELWSAKPQDLISVNKLISKLKSRHVTLLGGEPLQQKDIYSLMKVLVKNNVHTILFTGYELSELKGDMLKSAKLADVIITGRYIDSLKNNKLYLRGSTNQKIIFNTSFYKKKDFNRPNSFEVSINKDNFELRGRSKTLLSDLLDN